MTIKSDAPRTAKQRAHLSTDYNRFTEVARTCKGSVRPIVDGNVLLVIDEAGDCYGIEELLGENAVDFQAAESRARDILEAKRKVEHSVLYREAPMGGIRVINTRTI